MFGFFSLSCVNNIWVELHVFAKCGKANSTQRFVWLRKTEGGPGILISTCCLLVPNFHGSPHLKR